MNDSVRLGTINVDNNHYDIVMYTKRDGNEPTKMVGYSLNDVMFLEQPLMDILFADLERCLGKEKGTERQAHNEPIPIEIPKPFTPVNIDNKWLYSQEEVDAVFKERERLRKMRKHE